MRSLALAVVLCFVCAQSARAQTQSGALGAKAATPTKGDTTAPSDYRSPHFLLHTDLKPAEARALLTRQETILDLISHYWKQPLAGDPIECFVVRNLDAWPPGVLSELGRAKIAAKSGITTTKTISQAGRFLSGKSVVYAAADTLTSQHEIVHAYCGQTFGRTGPLWYSEGMAELGQFWQPDDQSVQTNPHIIKYLRDNDPPSVRSIVSDNAVDGETRAKARSGDSWQAYAKRWALCHFLVHNQNYSARFQALGLGFLNGTPARFAEAFSARRDELEFEFQQFLDNIEQGYRVDLCRWDWHHTFRNPSPLATSARILANRGWQPSGAIVRQGESYQYECSGSWSSGKNPSPRDTTGKPNAGGRLLGVVLHDFQLSKPFPLGEQGTFSPPRDGKLYLRCDEPWHALSDNTGRLTVKIRGIGGIQPPAAADTTQGESVELPAPRAQ